MTSDRELHLFVPPQRYVLEGFSSGIISIANYVKQKEPRTSVYIHDLSHFPEYKVESYLKSISFSRKTFFVGITTTTATYQSALRLAKKIKEVSNDAVVVFGGHHAKVQDRIILKNHPEVDVVATGEGEMTILELIRRYPDLSRVPGVTFRDRQGLNSTPLHPLLPQKELDSISHELSGLCNGSPLGKFDHVTYVSARGCPLKCTFCAVADEKIRSKSIDVVIKDLKYLVLDKGFKRIAIEDNFFAQSQKRTLELCNAIIKAKEHISAFDFTWDCQTRVESLTNPEVVSAMRSAGCEAVYLGIENFDGELLAYLGKSNNPARYIELTEKVVKLLADNGIDCYANIQIGLPGEDEKKKRNNLIGLERIAKIARKKKRKLVIFPMLGVVYPGTDLFKKLIRRGLSPDIFEEYTRWEERHECMNAFLAHNFAHGTGGIPTGIIDIDSLKRSKFSVNKDRIFWVVNYLYHLRKIPCADVFDYSNYIVFPEHQTPNSSSLL